MSCSLRTPHIAIIGAGIAGLACAAQLEKLGIRVSIFDKSRGASGRMSTRRGDGWQADHGAQYFTARDPVFVKELARWQSAGVADLWQTTIAVLDASSLDDSFLDDSPVAANPPQRRHNTASRYVGVPRMSSPARWLAAELDVTPSSRVIKLIRHEHRWRLRFDTSTPGLDTLEKTEFDAVVLAIPSVQAAELTQSHSARLSAQCEASIMLPCWAVMLGFSAPVSLPFDAAFVNTGPLRWIARDNSKPARPDSETWVLHANTAWSEQHLEDSPDAVVKALTQAFNAFGGPTPDRAIAHRWRYSQPASSPKPDVCAWDPTLKLGLCGDWLNGGRVEGAWLSGHRLARAITSMD
jgi:predicted NAD/FAD-dependent oxidoreductase